MHMSRHFFKVALCALVLCTVAGCQHNEKTFPNFEFTGDVPMIDKIFAEDPPVLRQPVLPEMLVGCRGHVLVPALGMYFVSRGKEPPSSGQYIREERLTAPYRVIPFGARVSVEQSAARLNVELDKRGRVIGLYCG
jgi:hypothetical protein